MKLSTPEIAWHGKEPIFSVDFSKTGPTWRLASAGADNDVKVSLTSQTEIIYLPIFPIPHETIVVYLNTVYASADKVCRLIESCRQQTVRLVLVLIVGFTHAHTHAHTRTQTRTHTHAHTHTSTTPKIY